MKKGFTLVELSIVLVIIGLLIGGILVGQSLIESAKINAAAQQFQKYDAAVMAFNAKYKGIPGDSRNFGGNGDGFLTSCCGGNMTRFMGEMGRFWFNMFPEQFKNCSGQCQALTSGANKNVPISKLGSPNSFIIASATSLPPASNPNVDLTPGSGNYYVILSSSNIQTQVSSEWQYISTNPVNVPSAVEPLVLMALDSKIDDGIANSGNVISGSINGGASGSVKKSNALATCSSGASYRTDINTYECTPLIRIGAQAGNLQ